MACDRFFALVPAAGAGRRMKLSIPKQYLGIRGKSVLERTVEALSRVERLGGILVVVSPNDERASELALPRLARVVRCGGSTRAETVRNGVSLLLSDESPFPVSPSDWILVHDAARPFVSPEDVARLIGQVSRTGVGAILGMPVADTVKSIGEGARITGTIDRSKLFRAATPQAFRASRLIEALSGSLDGVTDEASAVERLGDPVDSVPGSTLNFKITNPEDAVLAEAVASILDSWKNQ